MEMTILENKHIYTITVTVEVSMQHYMDSQTTDEMIVLNNK
jgi:hypothetical protein